MSNESYVNLSEETILYIRSLISIYCKATDEGLCYIYNNSLYVLVNFGLLYKIPVNLPGVCLAFNCKSDICFDNSVASRMCSAISNINTTIDYNPLIYENSDLRSDETFESILNSKSSDGQFKYFSDISLDHKSFIITNKNMFQCNKPDKVSLKIYRKEPITLLYNFSIFKKKLNCTIELYCFIADLYYRR